MLKICYLTARAVLKRRHSAEHATEMFDITDRYIMNWIAWFKNGDPEVLQDLSKTGAVEDEAFFVWDTVKGKKLWTWADLRILQYTGRPLGVIAHERIICSLSTAKMCHFRYDFARDGLCRSFCPTLPCLRACRSPRRAVRRRVDFARLADPGFFQARFGGRRYHVFKPLQSSSVCALKMVEVLGTRPSRSRFHDAAAFLAS